MAEQETDVTAEETKETDAAAGEVTPDASENKAGGDGDDIKAQAQKIADQMVAKKMKGMPTKEELQAFKDWQESQKTADQKRQDELKEYAALKAENAALKNKDKVTDAGVLKKYASFVVFEVGSLEGDFDDNLKSYLTSHPEYLETEKPVTTGLPTKRAGEPSAGGVDAILQAKHPDIKF